MKMAKLLRFFLLPLIAVFMVSCDETVSNNGTLPPPPPASGAYYLSRITESQFSETDTLELATEFHYNQGRLSEIVADEYTLRFEYTNQTKVTSADYFAGGVFQFSSEFHYGADGKLVQIASYDSDVPSKAEFFYTDDVLSRMEYKTLVDNGWVTQVTSEFTYQNGNVAERLDTVGSGAGAVTGKTVYTYDDGFNPYRFLNANLQKFFLQFDMVHPLNRNNATSEKQYVPSDSEEPVESYTYAVTIDDKGRASKVRKKNVADDYVETERNFEYQ